MNKFIEHGNGISLVPVSKAKWFGRVWEDADSLCIVPPNLKFERPNGKSGQIMFQCILVGMGDMARSTLTKSKIGKIR